MKKLILGIIVLFNIHFIQAQLVQEYEIDAGYSLFQGDYGVRNDFSTTLKDNGFLISGKAYFDFLKSGNPNCYLCNHLKFPLNFNIGYSSLSFEDVDFKNLTSDVIKLKSFSGNIFQSSVSFGFEYHIGDLNKFSFGQNSFFENFDPYFGLTGGGAVYVVRLQSALGDYDVNPNVLPEAFKDGIYDKPGLVPMATFEAGLRFKINDGLQAVVNGKWLYYFSDKVDGLVPNPNLVDNLHNDWQFAPSVGVVFFIGNSGFYASK